jgi:hypothetical protein
METMFLVAGLAVAGLVGIAAAFYFSIRPGNSGKKRGSRVQPDRTSHTRPDRYQVNDSRPNRGRTAGGAATSRNYRAAERSTGPNAVSDHRGPGRSRARRPEADADRWASEAEAPGLHADRWAPEAGAPALHADRWAPEPEDAGLPAAATAAMPVDGATRAARGSSRQGSRRAAAEADAEQDGAAKSKRRSGWLKRGDIDEELWPTESFGGVSDEQFWDDMASDKPLATTARTAQSDSGSRRRPPDAVPLAGLGDTQVMGDRRSSGSDNGRGGNNGRGRDNGRGGSTGQQYQTGPQQAQTGSQPYRTGPRPVQAQAQAGSHYQTGPQQAQTGPQQTETGPQPYRTGPQSRQTGPEPYQTGPQPYQTGPEPYQTGSQQAQTGPQPAYASASDRTETRRRSREEDPLTSAAFSLRTSGPVDGRSYQQASRRSRDLSREQYEAAVSQDTQAFSVADTQAAAGGYPGDISPHRQFDSVPGGSPGGGRAAGSDRGDGYRGSAYPYSGSSDTPQSSSMSTPPYGQDYGGEGYGYDVPASPAEDPRRQPSRANGGSGGEANRATRPVYQPDGYQRGSTYPQRTYPPGNGYRGPYDPRGGDRR